MTTNDIPTVVITLHEKPERKAACADRLARQGVKFTFHEGVNATAVGITPLNLYMRDDPVNGYPLSPHHIGIWLSHYSVWAGLKMALEMGLTNAEAFMICEDDVDFHHDWKTRTNAAIASAPGGWDMIFPGSCDCGSLTNRAPAGDGLYRARPLCLHCYILTAPTLGKLITNHRKMAAPIDVAMYDDSFPSLNVFAILPRVADQISTGLNP